MTQSPEPRYRHLRRAIFGGVWNVAVGLFLVGDGISVLGFADPFFAQFRSVAYWIGWLFAAMGAYTIGKSVIGLFEADRAGRFARTAAAESSPPAAAASGKSKNAPVIRGGWLLFIGGFLILGFHNYFDFGRDFRSAYGTHIHSAGWMLVVAGVLVNIRLILGLIGAGTRAIKRRSSIEKNNSVDAAEPSAPASASPPSASASAADKKSKREHRPIVERRR